MRNRKIFFTGNKYELTFRTQEGLPMIAAPFMQLILKGILAAAQTMFPVIINNFLFMSNHLHMTVTVLDPEDLSKFVLYFKRESAHAINKLLGRRKHTVWEEGYDSPIIVDAETAIRRTVYMFANPATANLEDSIDKYPHLSSWSAFLTGSTTEIIGRVPREKIPVLPAGKADEELLKSLEMHVRAEAVGEYELKIDPFGWLDCFEESRGADIEAIRAQIVREVQDVEAKCRAERIEPVLGHKELVFQDIRKPHTPKKYGKRMICLGATKEIRKAFIGYFKSLAEHARIVIAKIRAGELLKVPPSCFAPGGHLSANIPRHLVPLPLA